MALGLRVLPLLLAALVFSLAMTAMAMKHSRNSLLSVEELEDAVINKKDKQSLVDFALHEYNKENDDMEFSRVSRVLNVRQQVVEGMFYYLNMKIGKTMCGKNRASSSYCPFGKEPRKLCSFVIYATEQGNYKALIKSKCQIARKAQ